MKFFSICCVLILCIVISASALEYSPVDSGPSQAILTAQGNYFGKTISFQCDFTKDPNRYEKKYSGLVSSKGGHSYHLVCYNPDKFFLKFWINGLKTAGEIKGLDHSKNINNTPYITLHFGSGSKILKERAQDKNNQNMTVKLTKYELRKEKGEALLQGTLEADWGTSGNIKANFNVLIQDIGLKAPELK